jgi:hypothetical protein
MLTTCPAYLILFDSIILTILAEEYRSKSSSYPFVSAYFLVYYAYCIKKMEKMWKEAVVACSKLLSRNLLQGTENY